MAAMLVRLIRHFRRLLNITQQYTVDFEDCLRKFISFKRWSNPLNLFIQTYIRCNVLLIRHLNFNRVRIERICV